MERFGRRCIWEDRWRRRDRKTRLEEITKKMENPETGLEDAFALYKEGDTLLKEAEKRISLVDKQVRALEDDGTEVDFQ